MPDASSTILPATKLTPCVAWSITDAEITLSLSGGSYPENAVEFYAPVFDWLHETLARTPQSVPFCLVLRLHYFNTSTSKVLDDIVEKLQKHYLDSERSVHAVYEVHEHDEDVYDLAVELFSEWDGEHFTIARYE